MTAFTIDGSDEARRYADVVDDIPKILNNFGVLPYEADNNNDPNVIPKGIKGEGSDGVLAKSVLASAASLSASVGVRVTDVGNLSPINPAEIVLRSMPTTINSDNLNILSLINDHFKGITTNDGTKNKDIHNFRPATDGAKKSLILLALFFETFSSPTMVVNASTIIPKVEGKAML